MSEKNIQKPSEAELEILQALWEYEPCSVRAVHEQLVKKKDVGYTTTLKQMQRMLEKSLIKRDGTGKSHVYSANISQSDIKASFFDKVLDGVFQGSAMDLVMHALGRGKTSPEELAELRSFLDKMEGGEK
ncbi:BlaI/MecI/CopY family transcriptional regulator [Reichenbachiella sp. MALMAid0571]|uniref:BlaI/MecI/CopY family transcriptional regulator n=1 Tax=Reichenbachiella sp. MALMAid0571 TaxID=3143939 RepID=UPI0032DFD137